MARTAGCLSWDPRKETPAFGVSMSVARGFGLNGKSIYMNVTKPQIVECNFVVDSTNGNGLGIRSLKSNGYIENVFMHTSATPGRGTGNFLNPNPAVGFVNIQFKNNFNYYLGGFSGFVSTVSGSAVKVDNSALTIGQAYVITTLGNSTLANWQAIGFPVGFTPAVGSSFIATAIGVPGEANTSTSRVMVPKVSGIQCFEVVGDPNQMIANAAISPNAGAQLIVQLLGATNSSTTTLIPTAPADGTVLGMSFWFDGSSVTIDGI